MRFTTRTGIVALLGSCSLLAVSAAPVHAAGEAAPDRLPEFTVRSLGTMNLGDPIVTAVNDKGSAVGVSSSRVGGEIRRQAFFRDRRGDVTPIVPTNGGSDVILVGLNRHDWAIGLYESPPVRGHGPHHAVVWNERDGLIDLGTLGGSTSMADGINDRNQVVGYTDTAGERRAFLWEQGEAMRILSVPAGSGTSQAHDINNKGTIAGHTYLSGGGRQHANLWTRDGTFVDLGELPGGHEEAAAFAVNERDHAVGYSISDQGHRAFFWSDDTGMINIGALPGSTEGSVAHDINDRDWVVGWSRSPGPTSSGRAILWTPQWGLRDLNSLLDDDSSGWKLYQASWVSDQGDILAVGQLGQQYHVVMLSVHNPEPGGVMLLGAASAALLLRRRRQARVGALSN